MTYGDIIASNAINMKSDWPYYAFHMASLENAASILSTGYVRSRNRAKALGVMSNDNASKGVINHTDDRVKSYARFYFRPKTPTYYYMEGYHQPGLRFQNDDSVNVPVPVLFLFDLETLLNDDRTMFNGIKASGHNFNPQKGIEAFAQLQFDKIYHSGQVEDYSIYSYRHAEILYPDEYPILHSLKRIVCRNNCEALTLKSLLRTDYPTAYMQWESMIEYDESFFDLSGLRINSTRNRKRGDILSMQFELLGHEDYYRYIKSRSILKYTPLKRYPVLDIIFDVTFEGTDYNKSFKWPLELDRGNVFSAVDDIPPDASTLCLRGYFDSRENLILSVRAINYIKDFKKYEFLIEAFDTMHYFPVGL